jgi:hypothetical protein
VEDGDDQSVIGGDVDDCQSVTNSMIQLGLEQENEAMIGVDFGEQSEFRPEISQQL